MFEAEDQKANGQTTKSISEYVSGVSGGAVDADAMEANLTKARGKYKKSVTKDAKVAEFKGSTMEELQEYLNENDYHGGG